MTWTLFVPGTPRATQTGSVVRAGHRLVPLRRNAAWAARVALAANQAAPPAFFPGPLAVTMRFQMPRPRSGRAGRRLHPTVRPDVENLSKGLADALEGILYADDAAIVRLVLEKTYHSHPGVWLIVETVERDLPQVAPPLEAPA